MMIRRFAIVILLAAALLLGAATGPAQQPGAPPPTAPQAVPVPPGQSIGLEVNLVDVLYTVLNRRNKLVIDLNKDDFRVLDDGKPQEIRYFSRQTDLPLRIGMLLDTSNSIRDRIQFEKDAATGFLFNVLRHGKDQAFVMIFDDRPSILQGFTEDAGRLRDEIMAMKAGGGTAMYDAIYEACEKELSNPPRPPGDQPDVVRRVMIVISDGDDNYSQHTRGEAIEMAQRTSVVIYTISTSTQWVSLSETNREKLADRKVHKTEGDQILKDIAEETGGRAFFPYHVDDLDQSFQDIGDELRSQYSLTYRPSNFVANGKYHKIKIHVEGRKDLQVRARRGYYAHKLKPGSPKSASPGAPSK